MALCGRFLILLVCDFLTALTPLGWCHPGSVFTVRSEYAVEARQVHSGFGHQGRQFGNDKSAGKPICTTAGRPQGGAQGSAP